MNPLTDVLPARVRQVAYATLFVAALIFAAYQAADGDWVTFVGGLITALLGATAASNTHHKPESASAPYAQAVARQNEELKEIRRQLDALPKQFGREVNRSARKPTD